MYLHFQVMYSAFSGVDVLLNNINVTKNNTHYPYKMYLQFLSSYSNTSKMAELQAGGWYSDTTGKFNVTSAENTG
jgi:hypothetical protein